MTENVTYCDKHVTSRKCIFFVVAYIAVLLGIYSHIATHTYVVLDDIEDNHHPQAWEVGVPDSN